MTTPENPQATLGEATPYQLARELLGRSALAGEQTADAFNSMLSQAYTLTHAFSDIMLEHGCTPDTSESGDPHESYWVVRKFHRPRPGFSEATGKYGGGEQTYKMTYGNHSQGYYDIVVDARTGKLATATLNTHRTAHDFIGRSIDVSEGVLNQVFNVAALRENPAACRQAIQELTRDLQSATKRYTAAALTKTH